MRTWTWLRYQLHFPNGFEYKFSIVIQKLHIYIKNVSKLVFIYISIKSRNLCSFPYTYCIHQYIIGLTQQKIAIIQVVYSCIFIVYTHYTRNMQNMQDAYLYILYILVYLLYNAYIQDYTEFCIFWILAISCCDIWPGSPGTPPGMLRVNFQVIWQ